MKLDAKTFGIIGLAIAMAGAWTDMRVAVARLETKLEAVDRRVLRIEESLEPKSYARTDR